MMLWCLIIYTFWTNPLLFSSLFFCTMHLTNPNYLRVMDQLQFWGLKSRAPLWRKKNSKCTIKSTQIQGEPANWRPKGLSWPVWCQKPGPSCCKTAVLTTPSSVVISSVNITIWCVYCAYQSLNNRVDDMRLKGWHFPAVINMDISVTHWHSVCSTLLNRY